MNKGGINIDSTYLTEQEAAEYLKTCRQNVRKWRKGNLIKGVKISRSWLYRKKDLDDFFDEFVGKDISAKHYLNFTKKD